MQKRHMLLIIIQLLLFVVLHSTSFEVCLSGTKDFSSIQSAIDSSANGGVITVYPGVYEENIKILGMDLTLQSLYAINGDREYIETTVISGEVSKSAITIYGTFPTRPTVTIDGFTIMNNEQGIFWEGNLYYYGVRGGGICIEWSNALIKNNIIKNCLATSGGGIFTTAGSDDHIIDLTVLLENNQIFDNMALSEGGGGIAMLYSTKVIFSEEHRNSVYNNQAFYAHDIRLPSNFWDFGGDIFLDKGSRLMTTGDDFFIGSNYAKTWGITNPKFIKVHMLQEALPPVVNHDLYVAPWGDDDNSGLSPETALKTINRATKLIASDPVTPKTIYLAAGEYSPSLNSQVFPFSLPNFVNLVGAGMGETIINGEENAYLFGNINTDAYNVISDMSFTNFTGSNNNSFLLFSLGSHMLKNLSFFENNLNYAIEINSADTVDMNNIHFKNSGTINMFYNKNISVNDLNIDNAILSRPIFICYNDKVFMNNVIMTNSVGSFIQTWWGHPYMHGPISKSPSIVINNALITNNESKGNHIFTFSHFEGEPLVTDEIFVINNATIANNKGYHSLMHSSSYVKYEADIFRINNSILYNPAFTHTDEIDAIDHMQISNSLLFKVESVEKYIDIAVNSIFSQSPKFIGKVDEKSTLDMIDYYHLHESSLCINTGHEIDLNITFPEFDLAGNSRIYGDKIDMGAFEFQGRVSEFDFTTPGATQYSVSNYPNPFNPTTTIKFRIENSELRNNKGDDSQHVNIDIFNIKGQKVHSLVNSVYPAGEHRVIWNGTNDNGESVSSGIYFYRMQTDNFSQTQKMLLMK